MLKAVKLTAFASDIWLKSGPITSLEVLGEVFLGNVNGWSLWFSHLDDDRALVSLVWKLSFIGRIISWLAIQAEHYESVVPMASLLHGSVTNTMFIDFVLITFPVRMSPIFLMLDTRKNGKTTWMVIGGWLEWQWQN